MPNNAYRNNTFASRFGVAARHDDQRQRHGAPHRHDATAARTRSTSSGSPTIRRRHGRRPTRRCVRAVADHRPLAEHGPLQRRRSGLSLRQSVADRHAVRSVGVRQLPRQHRDDHRRQRILGHRPGDPRLRRHLSVAVRLERHASPAVRPDQRPRDLGVRRRRRRRGSRTSTARPARRRDRPTRNNAACSSKRAAQRRGICYVNGGLGFDHNDVFGTAWTPRVSVAAYLRQPSSRDALGDTKLTFNAGKGIKEPSISRSCRRCSRWCRRRTARRALGVAAGRPGAQPQRRRRRRAGAGAAAAVASRVAYFNNDVRRSDRVRQQERAAAARRAGRRRRTPSGFGAYVNSQSNRAQRRRDCRAKRWPARSSVIGVVHLSRRDRHASRSAAARCSPAINPAFPGIAIGAFSPLVGARPFRRPANSGSLVVVYATRQAQVAARGLLRRQAGRQHVPERRVLRQLDAAAEPGSGRGLSEVRSQRVVPVHPRLRGYVDGSRTSSMPRSKRRPVSRRFRAPLESVFGVGF